MHEPAQKQLDRLYEEVAQLCRQGQYEQAVPISIRVRDLTRQYLGENQAAYAASLNNLAELYQVLGDYAAAEPLLRQTSDIWRTALGEDHPHYAASLNNLAALYHDMGNYTAAEPLYRQAGDIRCTALGEDHPDYAASLNNLAELYHDMGDYTAAEPLLRQASDIVRTALGADHPHYAISLNNLGGLYHDMGDYAAAEPLYRQALDITRAALGADHPDYASNLNNLALLYHDMGDYAAAEPLYRQALDITRAALGEDHPDVAHSLNTLGGLYHDMGDYAAAEPLYRQALDITRAALGEDHPDYASSLNNLAELYQALGDYPAAEPLLRQALDITRAALGEDHPDYAGSLNNLGGLYEAMGNFAAAEPLYRQASDIARAALGEGHPHYASSLNNLAELYRALGDYAVAEPLYRQALDITRAALGEDHPDYASSLNNLALLYHDMGDYTAAEPLYRQALDIVRTALGEDHPDYASNLDNLAELYHDMGDYAVAEPLYRQALDITRTALGAGHPDYASNLNNLGGLYHDMGDYAAAEPLLRQASDIVRTTLGEDHPDYAASLNNLGGLYHDMGDYTAAEPLYRQALDITRAALGEDHPDYAASLNNLAELYGATGRHVEALTLMQEAAAIDDQMIGQIFSIGSESQRMAYLATLQGTFHSFLSLVVQSLSHSGAAQQVGLDLVLRRKVIGAEALAAQRDAVLGGRYPALHSKLQELTNWRRQIAQKTLAGPGPEGAAAHQKLLAEWTAQKERLEADLARQIPEMNLEQKLRAADRGAVARALPDGAALVEFVRFDVVDSKAVPARGESQWKPAHYLAFVLPAGEPDNLQMVDLGQAEPIERMLADFRACITGEAERRDGRQLMPAPSQADLVARADSGAELRAALFDPLLPALAGRRRLLLSPDGDLTRLPFEALPTDDGRRLVDEYSISYLGVGRDVLRFAAPLAGQPAAPLVVADPDFDLESASPSGSAGDGVAYGRRSRDLGRGSLRFGRLPGTRLEGEQVAALLEVSPWLAGAALEARLKGCRAPRILHIATHGFFLADQERQLDRARGRPEPAGNLGRLSAQRLENPLLRSGLALAGANTWLQARPLPPEAEDGILTAEDVSGLDLQDTELVVLSACETGLGEVQVGEGVFGLRRSFVLAGAKTLVMSLWKVPDRQTQELMEDFYRRILAGQPRAEALRTAQLAMKARYPDPLYWGAFICQGDPGPLAHHG